MARRNYFDHVSPEGVNVAKRVDAEGYDWRSVAENIAAGVGSADAAMANWTASAAHCRNMMDPVFTEVGVACAHRTGTQWDTYWTMVLGRRRR